MSMRSLLSCFGGADTPAAASMPPTEAVALLSWLQAGSASHPIDAAAVKELYGSGTAVAGRSVMRKTAASGKDSFRSPFPLQ